MSRASKKIIRSGGLILTAALLFLVIRQTDMRLFFNMLKHIRPVPFVLALIVLIVDYCIASFRWKILFSAIKNCSYYNMLSTMFIGRFYNTLLPARFGELVKIYIINKKENVSKSSALSTIILEHVFDAVAILLLAFMVINFIEIDVMLKHVLTAISVITAILCLILLALLKMGPKKKFSFLSVKLENTYRKLVEGLEVVKKRSVVLKSLLLSLSAWFFNAMIYYFTAMALGIKLESLFSAIFLMAVITIATVVPIGPAHLGVFEYVGIMVSRQILPVSSTAAFAFVFLAHTLQIFIPMLIALLILFLENRHYATAAFVKERLKDGY